MIGQASHPPMLSFMTGDVVVHRSAFLTQPDHILLVLDQTRVKRAKEVFYKLLHAYIFTDYTIEV